LNSLMADFMPLSLKVERIGTMTAIMNPLF